jgi:hypothetical protein
VLISEKLQSVTLSRLELTVEQTKSHSNPDPSVLNLNELLPQEVIEQLPAQTLQIRQWNVEYRSPDATLLSARGDLLVAERLDLYLETTLADSDIAVTLRSFENNPVLDVAIRSQDSTTEITSLSAQLQQARSNGWDWQLQGKWHDKPLLNWLRQLSTVIELPLDITPLETMKLTGSGEFTAQIRHPSSLSLPFAPDQSVLHSFDAAIHMMKVIEQLEYPGTIDGLAGTLDTTAVLQGGHIKITIEPFQLSGNLSTGKLAFTEDTLHWLRWKETVPVLWSGKEALKIIYSDGTGSAQLHSTLIELGDAKNQLRLEGLNLDVSLATGEPLLLETHLSTSIKTRLRKKQLPQFELAFSQKGNIEKSLFSVALSDTAESIKLNLEGTANLTTGEGRYRLGVQSLDLPYFASAAIPVLRHFGLMQSSLEILTGSLELDSTLKSTDFVPANWTQESKLTVQGLSGSYDEYHFDNLALTANWTGVQKWKTAQPATLTLEKLNIGFEVRDIVVRASLPKATSVAQPAGRIEEFSADMFGGQLYLPQATRWDFSSPGNAVTLRARNWQLAEMVALQQDEDIKAQGTLEGELPVTITDGRMVIAKGYLKALPPGGSIRYVANDASRALADSNNELALALDLLNNFQYQVLSSSVELDKEGNLLLGLSLAGHNPTQFDGRPINFNINLEQNLDPLLQSLRLSGKLAEKIESRLQ